MSFFKNKGMYVVIIFDIDKWYIAESIRSMVDVVGVSESTLRRHLRRGVYRGKGFEVRSVEVLADGRKLNGIEILDSYLSATNTVCSEYDFEFI